MRRALTVAGVLVGAALLVTGIAFALRAQQPIQQFMSQYPGVVFPVPEGPTGIPVWLNVTHFLNALFLLLIIRTGMLIRGKKRPPAFWTPRAKIFGQAPRRVSIHVWLHNAIDILWIVNGAAYLVLLFATGQWVRIVPTSAEVWPNAVSAGLQYFTFSWPIDNPWVTYNALQQLSYFAVIFVLAPVAILTGLRLSQAWPVDAPRLNRAIPEKPVRWVHNVVLWLFLLFVVIHVDLVLFTGAVHNLNVMFAANDGFTLLGVGMFLLSLAVMAGAWFALSIPVQKRLAGLTGKVQ